MCPKIRWDGWKNFGWVTKQGYSSKHLEWKLFAAQFQVYYCTRRTLVETLQMGQLR